MGIQDFVVTKLVGRLLIFTGLVGIMGNIAYDRMVERCFDWGWAQWVAFGYFVFLIIVGFISNEAWNK